MADGRSLRQQAYEHILRKLTRGELAAGALVSEPSLARELNMSRTPVREAIQQLALEGLVESVPRYGTIVRAPDRREMAELFEVREAMESHAAAKAAESISAQDVALLRRLCREMEGVAAQLRASGEEALDPPSLRRFLAVDMAFHMVLLRATGNQRMMKIVADFRVFLRIFSYPRQTHDLPVVARACEFHRAILDAVERRDPAAARAEMSEHIRVSRDAALACFDRRRPDAAAAIALALPEDLRDALSPVELGLEAEAVPDRYARRKDAKPRTGPQ